MRYTVVLSPDPNGGYTVTSPAMPGLVTDGPTREAALANARMLAADFIEHGESPLNETPALIAAEVESVLADREAEGWDATIELVTIQPVEGVTA